MADDVQRVNDTAPPPGDKATTPNAELPADLGAQMLGDNGALAAIQIMQGSDLKSSGLAGNIGADGKPFEAITAGPTANGVSSLEMTDPYGNTTVVRDNGTGTMETNDMGNLDFSWKQTSATSVQLDYGAQGQVTVNSDGKVGYSGGPPEIGSPAAGPLDLNAGARAAAVQADDAYNNYMASQAQLDSQPQISAGSGNPDHGRDPKGPGNLPPDKPAPERPPIHK
jgi:hypothetical protein